MMSTKSTWSLRKKIWSLTCLQGGKPVREASQFLPQNPTHIKAEKAETGSARGSGKHPLGASEDIPSSIPDERRVTLQETCIKWAGLGTSETAQGGPGFPSPV